MIEDAALGKKVGMIWLARILQGSKPLMFIYDVRIDEAHRRQGYGEQVMLAAEVQAKMLGLDTIALHVFGFNHAARALYEKLGYEITKINMAKKLTAWSFMHFIVFTGLPGARKSSSAKAAALRYRRS